jgi:6-pyruvoyltetrahydropterin/6-carboxytetrahydropterin synthase
MYKIITKVKFEYAHRLVLHRGKCRHVHGHSGEATIELGATELNDNGFVMDFTDVKTPLKEWVDEQWDHAYLANQADPLLPIIRDQGLKTFVFPHEPTAELMAKFLFEQFEAIVKPLPGVTLQRIIIQETCTGLAVYER